MTTLVIGSGVAGLAAAWALRQAGQAVSVIDSQPGASEFSCGAYDVQLWESTPDTSPVSAEMERFLATLDVSLPRHGAWVATPAGVVRPTRAVDAALLNLQGLGGQVVGVVDVPRPGWDAESLALSYQESAWARRTRTQFVPVPVPLSPQACEAGARLSDYDWACELESSGAGREIVRHLQARGSDFAGYLCGPWLGVSMEAIQALRQPLDRPLGEALSEPGGTAGERFARARQRLLNLPEIQAVVGRAHSLESTAEGWVCHGDFESESELSSQRFRHAIVAVGGLVGGGVRFLSGEEKRGGRSFLLSLTAPVRLRLRRREVEVHSGLQGVDLQALGMEALTEVGVSVGSGFRVDSQPGLYAVGDVVADQPRTALVAIASGLSAAGDICAARDIAED